MKYFFLICGCSLVVVLALAGCGGGSRESQLEATVVALQTQVADATTMAPAATATTAPPTEVPTAVPPTATAEPTDTPRPTATPIPPTATPTTDPLAKMEIYRDEEAGFAVAYPAVADVKAREGGMTATWDGGWMSVIVSDLSAAEQSVAATDPEAERVFMIDLLASPLCTEPAIEVDAGEQDILGGSGWVLKGVCTTPEYTAFQSMLDIDGNRGYWLDMVYPQQAEADAVAIADSFERFEPSLPAPFVRVSSASANLRAGPGTNYPTVGSAPQGTVLEVLGKNEKGDWWQVKQGDGAAWIAGSVAAPGGDVAAVAVAKDIPTPPPAPPTPTPAPPGAAPTATPAPAQGLTIGSQVDANGWSFKVYDVKRRKVVYFYDDSYVAQGNFVLVFVEATNHLPGTSYFGKDLRPWLTDKPGTRYSGSSKGSIYAQWQLGGLDSFYTDVNPGQTVRMLEAYDVPDGVGEVSLSLNPPLWIALENADAIPVEP